MSLAFSQMGEMNQALVHSVNACMATLIARLEQDFAGSVIVKTFANTAIELISSYVNDVRPVLESSASEEYLSKVVISKRGMRIAFSTWARNYAGVRIDPVLELSTFLYMLGTAGRRQIGKLRFPHGCQ